MIMDRTLLFSDKQAITATAASTNIVDLGATGTVYGAASPVARDIGPGTDIPLFVGVVESFNNLTSLSVAIQTDDNVGFSTPTTIWTGPAYVLADLAAGKKYLLPDRLPIGVNERYVRLNYTVVGTAPTTGRITAGVTMGNQTNR
jgi:hypothetical protein